MKIMYTVVCIAIILRACGVTWIAHRASDPRVAGSNPAMLIISKTSIYKK